MNNFCLPKDITKKFLEGLKSRSIDPAKLADMTSQRRHEYLARFVGEENASSVNSLFESKLLLKNQKAGMVDWARSVGSLKPEVRRDIINRIQKLDKAITGKGEKAFLSDLVDQKLGIGVTPEEAKTIFELSKKITDAKDYTGIKKVDQLLEKLETFSGKKITDIQKKSLDDVKAKVDEQKAQQEKEKQLKISQKKAEADFAREERAFEKKLEAFDKQQEREKLLEERRGIREKFLEDQRLEREKVKADSRDAREAVGISIMKMRKVFGKDLTPEIKSEIQDIVGARRSIAEGEDRLIYGRAKVRLENYVSSLLDKSIGQQFKERPLSTLGGTMKSIKASLDDSAIFRQGWKTMFTHPEQWQRNARKSFGDIARSLGGQNTLDEVRADIVSRPTYEKMKEAKLAVGIREESFPSTVPEKIPVFGRLYKASENAFTGFVFRQRADVFDKYLKVAEEAGVDINDKHQLESIGKLVNSLTGRGNLGALESAGNVVNNVFFSPRSVKAMIDTLTLHAGDKMSSFARKQSAVNLVKIIAGTAVILAVANALNPNSVESDPRSADFGKIKIGNTRFDVTGGMSSLVTLGARLIPALWGKGATKSSTTGKITPINSGKFGSQTGWDVLLNFGENKLSPISSIVKDILQGTDFSGNKISVGGELSNAFVPLPITNYAELAKDPNSANKLIAVIADALGIGTNTYSAKKKK